MWKTKRISHSVAAIQNAAKKSLVKITVAAYLNKERKKNKAYSAATAVIAVGNNWSTAFREVGQQPYEYGLYLSWMARNCAEIIEITSTIDIKKVAEVRKQGLKSATVFEDKLNKIVRLIEDPVSGIRYSYREYTKKPAEIELEVMIYLGQVKAEINKIRRIIRVLQIPLVRGLLLDVNPVVLLLCSCILFCAIYLATTSLAVHSVDPASIHAAFISDSHAMQKIWHTSEVGLWSKMVNTLAVLGDVTALAPLGLALMAALLYPVRHLLNLSGIATSKIASTQSVLFEFAKQLGVKRALINVEEIHMDTTTIGSIGAGAVVNIGGYMANVTTNVGQNLAAAQQAEDIKSLVEELTKKIAQIAPEISADTARAMGADVENLSKEMTLSKPRKKWYELSLSGLQEAAEAVGKVGVPIVELVKKLSPLLLD